MSQFKQTCPISKAGNGRRIGIPKPFPQYDDDNKLRRDAEGHPIYNRAPLFPPVADMFSSAVKKIFILDYCFHNAPISNLAAMFFMQLAETTTWSDLILLTDDRIELPYMMDDETAIAEIRVQGNLTTNQTYAMMCNMMHLSRESEETIKGLITELKSQKLIRSVPQHKDQESKLKRKAGRPLTVMKFELHPRYAWNGYAEHCLGYLNELQDFDDIIV